MEVLVCIIEDQPETRADIAESLTSIEGIRIVESPKPWELLQKLQRMDGENYSGKGVVIADLYIRGYWRESPKPPYSAHIKTSEPKSGEDLESMKNAIIDCIHNYLDQLLKEYKFKLIIYSHTFTFFKRVSGTDDLSKEVEQELASIGVPNADIVRKEFSSSDLDTKGSEKGEIKLIQARVREAIHALRSEQG